MHLQHNSVVDIFCTYKYLINLDDTYTFIHTPLCSTAARTAAFMKAVRNPAPPTASTVAVWVVGGLSAVSTMASSLPGPVVLFRLIF